MTLRSRLIAIERAIENSGFGIDRCETCGGPDPNGGRLVVVGPGEEPRRCGTCASPVDELDRALGPIYKVIVLSGGASGFVSP